LEWLLLLACPLMMLFCMKGMFSGNKKGKKSTATSNVPSTSQVSNELQTLQIKMAELMEQNHQLMKEMKSIKEETQNSSENVVELKENQDREKKEIS
jgi:predicted transcriptional regulator